MTKTTTTNRTSSGQQDDLFGGADCVRTARTRNSALWAAYGDALGFISELVNEKGLNRRTKGEPLDRLMAWERRVGGRGGVVVQLPQGCWSDDTQLRMGVSRSISNHGFDVETFARVELPVWPSYALGGGRASKAAAKNLGKPQTIWYANTFPRWVEAGGNGAAMRIQPHVWASPDLEGDYMRDVIADAICTHGHLRAIIGACFYAVTLAHCLKFGRVPELDECAKIALDINDTIELAEDHELLGSMWIGLWERETGKRLRQEWQATVSELHKAIEQAAVETSRAEGTSRTYREVSERLGLQAAHQRGSGVLTTVAAVALARFAPDPYEGIVAAANALGTDTDTIATMTGALLGACDGTTPPPEEVLDSTYLLQDAERLVAISKGHKVKSHSYPDLLTWTAPRTQADALVSHENHLEVEGLGSVTTKTDEAPSWTPRKDFGWQWVKTDFGQTLLIKRRPEVKSLNIGNSMSPPPDSLNTSRSRKAAKRPNRARVRHAATQPDRGVEVDKAVNYARQHLDSDRALGLTVREVARRGTLADLAALVTALRPDLQQLPARSTGRSR